MWAYDYCLSFPNAAAAMAAVLAAFGLSNASQYAAWLTANANSYQVDNVGGSYNYSTHVFNGKYDVNIISTLPMPAAFAPYVVTPIIRKRVWA